MVTSMRYVPWSLVVFSMSATSAMAVDVSPGDYTALTPGTNAVVLYQQYGKSNGFFPDGGPNSRQDTSMKSNTGILRLIRFMEIGGVTMDPQILFPFGHVYDAKIGGQSMGSASGFADPIVGATFWLVNQPSAGVSGRYVGITPLLTVPLGSYDRHRSVNMGGNRWVGDLQVGWIEPLQGNLSMELFGDVLVYGNNSDSGSNSQTIKQHTSYQVQASLRYDFNPRQRLAIGFSSTAGGKQYMDGIYFGQKTDVQQLRLDVQQMISTKVQMAAQLTHDTHADGGFKEDIGVNLRALFLF